jgi:hypothetical protein
LMSELCREYDDKRTPRRRRLGVSDVNKIGRC